MLDNSMLLGLLFFWVYLLSVLKRARTDAFYFLIGSAGLFAILLLWSKPYGVWLFSTMITWVVGVIGHGTGMFTTFYSQHIIQVAAPHHASILLVDYECSGIIETTAFWGLVAFFPVYSPQRRLVLAIIGALWFFAANVIRLSFIAIVIHFLGDGAFYIAHSILGRLLFYLIAILLYYLVFTKGQLVNRSNFTRGE